MHKHLLFPILLALPLLTSCGHSSSASFSTLAQRGSNVYLRARNFSPANKADWEALREQAEDVADAWPAAEPITVHVLDTANFLPPADGKLYGGDAVRKRVVAQYMRLPNTGQGELMADPFGFGKYTEPQ